MNRATLCGNVGRDPEIRRTQDGRPIANFRMATTEKWKDRDGNKKERTEWHSVVVFNEGLAGVVERFVKKGDKLLIEGTIRTRKWTDQQNVERYVTEIVIENFNGSIQLLGSPSGTAPPPADDPASYGTTRTREPAGTSTRDLDDEVPF